MKEAGWYRTGVVLGLIVRAWRRTVKLEVRGRIPDDAPAMLALWHGRTVGVLFDRVGTPTVAMTSRSGDGALAAGALSACGIKSARGSTGKGGREALAEMEAMVRDGTATIAALTVDGPRGPWRRVKAGTIVLARRLGVPIVPATFSCRRVTLLRSWDRMILPRPFSRVVVVHGTPIDPATLPDDIEGASALVTAALDDLGRTLDLDVVGRELWPQEP